MMVTCFSAQYISDPIFIQIQKQGNVINEKLERIIIAGFIVLLFLSTKLKWRSHRHGSRKGKPETSA